MSAELDSYLIGTWEEISLRPPRLYVRFRPNLEFRIALSRPALRKLSTCIDYGTFKTGTDPRRNYFMDLQSSVNSPLCSNMEGATGLTGRYSFKPIDQRTADITLVQDECAARAADPAEYPRRFLKVHGSMLEPSVLHP
jgi:hypothetical protein